MQISDTIIACYRVYPEKNQPLRPFEKEIFSYSMNYESFSFLFWRHGLLGPGLF